MSLSFDLKMDSVRAWTMSGGEGGTYYPSDRLSEAVPYPACLRCDLRRDFGSQKAMQNSAANQTKWDITWIIHGHVFLPLPHTCCLNLPASQWNIGHRPAQPCIYHEYNFSGINAATSNDFCPTETKIFVLQNRALWIFSCISYDVTTLMLLHFGACVIYFHVNVL